MNRDDDEKPMYTRTMTRKYLLAVLEYVHENREAVLKWDREAILGNPLSNMLTKIAPNSIEDDELLLKLHLRTTFSDAIDGMRAITGGESSFNLEDIIKQMREYVIDIDKKASEVGVVVG